MILTRDTRDQVPTYLSRSHCCKSTKRKLIFQPFPYWTISRNVEFFLPVMIPMRIGIRQDMKLLLQPYSKYWKSLPGKGISVFDSKDLLSNTKCRHHIWK